jgi:hypothetical protein
MQIKYWVAHWGIGRSQAALALGGKVESMVDCISAEVKPDLAAIKASSIRKIAGYRTGSPDVAWTPADWDLFPIVEGYSTIGIDQQPGAGQLGGVGDVESGAKSIADAIADAKIRFAQGLPYCVYVSASNLSTLEDEVARGGLAPGAIVAFQWASPLYNPKTPFTAGVTIGEANVDLSVTRDDWYPLPRRQVVPKPVPEPEPVKTATTEPESQSATVTYDKGAWSIKAGD